MANRGARYRVTGRRRFREHAKGSEFDAVLDPEHERRAIARGDITLIERFIFTLEPGSYELPHNWNTPTIGEHNG